MSNRGAKVFTINPNDDCRGSGTFACIDGSLWVEHIATGQYRDVIHRNELFVIPDGCRVLPVAGSVSVIKIRDRSDVQLAQFQRMVDKLAFPRLCLRPIDKIACIEWHLFRLIEGQDTKIFDGGFAVKITLSELAKYIGMERESMARGYLPYLFNSGRLTKGKGYMLELHVDETEYKEVFDRKQQSLIAAKAA